MSEDSRIGIILSTTRRARFETNLRNGYSILPASVADAVSAARLNYRSTVARGNGLLLLCIMPLMVRCARNGL